MQGPMVGVIDSSSVTIWVRVAGEREVTIRYSEHSNFSDAKITEPIRALEQNDYCVFSKIEGLEANAYYYYQVLLDGDPLDNERENEGYPILTAPMPGAPAKFSIGFGSGARADKDGLQAIWLQVQKARPHAFFWLGENESVSKLPPEFQAEEYRKQRSVPFLQPLLRSIPQLATWNATSVPSKQRRKESFEIFQRYWANPSNGSEEAPGSYFIYQYSGVDFIFLDTYSYRDEAELSTILGDVQMSWLQDQLSQSQAKFKVLLSGSSWTNNPTSNRNTWMAYSEDRAGLFQFISENEIEGVMLLSGDDDEAEIKAIPLSQYGGYDLYEIVSSPLAQEPSPDYSEDNAAVIVIEEPYADSMNFGMLTFDMSEADPKVTLQVINVFGESVFPSFELRASELSKGKTTWKSKVPTEAVAYFEARNASVLETDRLSNFTPHIPPATLE